MTVVEVFKRRLLFELGVLEQPRKPLVIPIGLLLVNQQGNKLRVGEIGVLGAGEPLSERVGHPMQFQGVEQRHGLLGQHDGSSCGEG